MIILKKTLNYQFYDRVINKMNIPFTLTLVSESSTLITDYLLDQLAFQIEQKLQLVEQIFSPFKETSLLKKYQDGDLQALQNANFKKIFDFAENAFQSTNGFFDSYYAGKFDPTGLVKGWAIEEIFNNLLLPLFKTNLQIVGISLNGGGDLQFATRPQCSFCWNIAIENPHQPKHISAVYQLKTGAIATSGFSKRGNHIANMSDTSLIQATIVAKSLTWADIWATAALVAGQKNFISLLAKNQLTGIMISPMTITPFSEGRLANAEKNSI